MWNKFYVRKSEISIYISNCTEGRVGDRTHNNSGGERHEIHYCDQCNCAKDGTSVCILELYDCSIQYLAPRWRKGRFVVKGNVIDEPSSNPGKSFSQVLWKTMNSSFFSRNKLIGKKAGLFIVG